MKNENVDYLGFPKNTPVSQLLHDRTLETSIRISEMPCWETTNPQEAGMEVAAATANTIAGNLTRLLHGMLMADMLEGSAPHHAQAMRLMVVIKLEAILRAAKSISDQMNSEMFEYLVTFYIETGQDPKTARARVSKELEAMNLSFAKPEPQFDPEEN